MSWINLGEVAYLVERKHGAEEAEYVVARVRSSVALDDVTSERVLAAARIKARHPIAYADCFAVVTAIARQAILLTGDPEILERRLGCRTRDLRPHH